MVKVWRHLPIPTLIGLIPERVDHELKMAQVNERAWMHVFLLQIFQHQGCYFT
jgi:hypothetical protein